MKHWILLFFLTILSISEAFAASGITYHGRILRPDGTPVTGNNVGFYIRVLTDDGTDCPLYEEIQTKNMTASQGTFAVIIGDGSVAGTYNVSGISIFDLVFENSKTFNFTAPVSCVGTPYAPGPRAGRKLQVQFRESAGHPWESLPLMTIAHTPFAYSSLVAQRVGEHDSSTLMRVENAGTPGAATALTSANMTELMALLGGTTTQYIKSVTGTAGQITANTTAGAVTLSLPNVGTPGTYGSATQVPVLTTDAQGRITGVVNTTITGAAPTGTAGGDLTGNFPNPTIINDAITTVKILDANVTTSKLANLSVDDTKLAANSVITTKILDANVTLSKLAADSVDSSKIVDGSITGSDISGTAALSIASIAATGNVGAGTMTTRSLGLFELPGNGTDSVTLQAPAALAGSTTYVLPAADGSANQILKTDGAGNLSWVNDATGGAPVDASYAAKGIVQFDTDAATSGITVASGIAKIATGGVSNGMLANSAVGTTKVADDAITFAKIQNINTNKLLGRATAAAGDAEEITLGTGLSFTGTTLNAADSFAALPCGNGYLPYRDAGAWTCKQVASANTNDAIITRDASGNFIAGTGQFSTSVKITDGAAGGQVTIAAPGTFTSYNLTLPVDDGTPNQVLQTNGSGVLSWTGLPSITGMIVDGGNATGAEIVIGTNDANKLSFETGNAKAMTIDAMGKVGIGTTTPNTALEVNGSVRGNVFGALRIDSGTGTVDIGAQNGTYAHIATDRGAFHMNKKLVLATGEITSASGGNNITLQTGGLTKMTILDSNGNVGIGTTTPNSFLSLSGAAARTIAMERNSTAATAGQGLTLSSGGAIAGTADLDGGDLILASGTATGSGSSSIQFKTATAGASAVTDRAPTTKMTISGSGSVGIGTTNPGAVLHVVGNQYVSTSLEWNGNKGRLTNGSAGIPAVVSIGANDISFGTNGSDEAIRIKQGTSNVGIGTTSPNGKLDVKGSMVMSGATSGYSGFQVPAVAGSTIYTLPTGDGSNGQVLKTDGAGILSWTTVGGVPGDASYAAKGIVQFDTDLATSGITVASGVAKIGTGGVGTGMIADDAVSFAKTQNIATNKLLGRGTAGSGNIEELTLGTGLSLTGTTLNASGIDAVTNTANLANTKIWIGDAGGKAQEFSLSGEATMTAGGVVTVDADSANTASKIVRRDVSGNFVATSPTFTTSVNTPMIVGGTSTTQTLTYKTTTGVGATGADHIFQVGNDGATEAMRILNSGNVGIGTNSPASKLDVQGDVNIVGPIKYNSADFIFLEPALHNLHIGQNIPTAATGNLNTGYGYRTLTETTTGRENIAVGAYSMGIGVDGVANVAIGDRSLGGGGTTGVTSGFSYNVAIGSRAMRNATGATYNVAIGRDAGGGGSGTGGLSGARNIIIGPQTGANVTSGSYNILIGNNINPPTTGGSNQLSIGNLIFGTGLDGTGTTASSGNVGIGTNAPNGKLDVKGSIVMSGATSGFSGFQVPAVAGSTVYTLPTGDGSNGQVLKTNGAGILAWTTVGGVPADASYAAKGIVQFDTDAATSGITVASGVAKIATGGVANGMLANSAVGTTKVADDAITFAKIQNINTNKLLGRATAAAGDAEEITLGTGLSFTGTTLNAADSFAALPCGDGYLPYKDTGAWTCKQVASANTNDAIITRDSSGNFIAGTGQFSTSVKITDGAAGGQVTIAAPGTFTSYNLTLPVDDGGVDQVLKTNGSGVLSWVNQPTVTGMIVDGGNTTGAEIVIGTNDAQKLSFETANTKAMTIDATGKVGIGTTAPAAALHVVTTGTEAARFTTPEDDDGTYQPVTLYRQRSSATAPAAGFGVGLNFSLEGFTNNSVVAGGRINTQWETTQSDDNTTRNSRMTFMTMAGGSQTEKMRITSGGNVGIGTTSPGKALHVAGTGLFGDTSTTTAGTRILQIYAGNASNANSGIDITRGAAGTYGTASSNFAIRLKSDGSGNYRGAIGFSDTNSPNETLSFSDTGGGRVGIGVTAPTSVLHLKAGAATAGQAPLKFNSGINLTTPENGAMEYDGTDFYLTAGGTRRTIAYTGGVGGGGGVSTTSQTFNSDSDNSGSDGGFNFQRNGSNLLTISNAGDIVASSTTGSTSSTTGAFKVAGGMGVAEKIFAGSDISTGGVFLAPLGAVGAPSYTFTGDTNTGAWSPLADTYAVSTAGAERLRIDALGNVGIGTTNPTTRLHVEEGGAPLSGNANGIYAFRNTYGGSVTTAVTRGIYGNGNYSALAVSPGAGAIGVDGYATNSWTGTLGTASGLFGIAHNQSTGTIQSAIGGSFEVMNTGGGAVDTGYGVYIRSIAGTEKFSLYASDATAKSYFAGRVGIGTTTPTATLHTKTTTSINQLLQESTTGGSHYYQQSIAGFNTFEQVMAGTGWTTTPNGTKIGTFQFGGIDATGTPVIRASSSISGAVDAAPTAGSVAGRLMFSTSASGSATPTERMRIDSAGNVGIGTNAPDSPLVVKSAATGSTAFKVLSSSGGNIASVYEKGSGGAQFILRDGSAVQQVRLDTSGDSYFNGGNVGIGTSTPGAKLDVINSVTATSGNFTGLSSYTEADASGASSAFHFNYLGTGTKTGNTRNYTNGFNGLTTQVYHDGTGTLSYANGSDASVIKNSTGPIGGAYGVNVKIENKNATGAITNAYGVFVSNFVRTGAITNSFGVYVEDSVAKNYFAGNVGIGTSNPTQKLEVNGSVLASSFLYSSDRRLKKEIIPMGNELNKILSLTPVTYHWISPMNPEMEREQIGLIAQEVQKVYPQAVHVDQKGWLRLDYPALVAPLIQAVKEIFANQVDLRQENEKLKNDIEALRVQNLELEKRLQKIERSLSSVPEGK